MTCASARSATPDPCKIFNSMNTQRRNLILEIANPQDVEAQFRALGPNLASPDPSKMWKIQTGSVGGWADLKVSSEEDVDDWYPTKVSE